MRLVVVFVACVMSFYAMASERLVVVDDETSEPLPASTVFSRSGIIIGLTDADGGIKIASDNDFPVTVRCMGYEPMVCDSGIEVVRMKAELFGLQELVVVPVDRPVLHLLCYIREYVSGVTGNDTVIAFNEHMGDFFLPTRKKVKGFKAKSSPRFLRSRLHSRIADGNGLDSIFVPEYRDDTFAWEDLVALPYEAVSETEAIRAGSRTDSVAGKYAVKLSMRRTDNLYMVQTDYLADVKSHSFSPFILKMLGLTIDFNELQGRWAYKSNAKGEYTPADIISGTFSLSVIGRGRWIKKAFKTDSPVQMYSFYEIYPVDAEYLTVEDAKAVLKDGAPLPQMTVSSNAPALSPAIQRMVDVCARSVKSK